jgi:hypothetical protein
VLGGAQVVQIRPDLPDRLEHGVDVLLRPEQEAMVQPDGLLEGGLLGHRAPCSFPRQASAEGGKGRRVHGEERAAVDGLVEEPVAGDALRLERGHEAVA